MDQPTYQQLSNIEKKQRLLDLGIVFTKLGMFAFGGPAAHIAMIDDEVVKRRQWMTQEKLLDLLGITNLIPGPNSTELAIHIGLEYGGILGLLIAGICFILPAMVIVWILAAIYVQSSSLPQIGWLLYGIKPAIVVVVLQALWKLAKKAVKNRVTAIIAVVTIVLSFLGLNEIGLLVVSGLVSMAVRVGQNRFNNDRSAMFWFFPTIAQVLSNRFSSNQILGGEVTRNSAETANWLSVFGLFLKIGSVLYGSGYVLLAFLQKDLVERLGWLTSQQLLDAIAVGQITPGPVFTTATFVGYLVAGNAGAVSATIGIFLPAFVLVALVHPWVTKLRQMPFTSALLDGINAASLGLMAAVTWQLLTTATNGLTDYFTILIGALAAIALFGFGVNSVWLVLAGGIMGFLHQLIFN
jgi:chromate transporter